MTESAVKSSKTENSTTTHQPPSGVTINNPYDDHFNTRLVHVGSHPDPVTGAIMPPISLSTTFAQAAIGVNTGFEYARSLNPNRLALETLIASLEGVDKLVKNPSNAIPLPCGLAVSSGSAATATVINALVPPGNHVVVISDVYGGTFHYLSQVANQLGIKHTLVDLSFVDDSQQTADLVIARLKGSIIPNLTKLIWIETPTNPTLKLVDIPCLSAFARAHNLLLVVDSTFLSPFYQRPISLGADVVIHSVTKYINGHSDVMLGLIVSPNLGLLEKMRFLQNAHGAVPSAFDCWLAQRGAKTLALRMLRHGTNALAIASWLKDVAQEQGWITDLNYIGLTGSKIAWKQIPESTREELSALGFGSTIDSQVPARFPYGGMISFRIRTESGTKNDSDFSRANEFLKNCRLFTLAESLGGIESLLALPAKMSHQELSPEDRKKAGIDCTLIRMSVGIENVHDLISDLEQSFLQVFESSTEIK